MSLAGLAIRWVMTPPKPPTPLERAAKRAFDWAVTACEAADLACEILPPTAEEEEEEDHDAKLE